VTQVDDLIQRWKQQVFLAIIRGLLIAFPNADDPPSGNHESLKSKIQKRKKARLNIPLSRKIQYYIKTNSAYFSARSAFFTDDPLATSRAPVTGTTRPKISSVQLTRFPAASFRCLP